MKNPYSFFLMCSHFKGDPSTLVVGDSSRRSGRHGRVVKTGGFLVHCYGKILANPPELAMRHSSGVLWHLQDGKVPETPHLIPIRTVIPTEA